MLSFSLILVAHKFVWHATFKCIAVIMPFVGGVSLCAVCSFNILVILNYRETGK